MKRKLLGISCVLALVALRGGFAIAEDTPAATTEGAARAAIAAGAAGTVEGKTDPAVSDELSREARSFLTLVRDAADDKAYERMSAEFRKGSTAEKFAKDLNDFREKSPMPPSMAVTGDAWLKPKDGGPPRATLRAQMARGAMFGGVSARGFRPSMLTLSLVQQDGKWKVAALHDMMTRDSGVQIGKALKTDRKDPDRIKVASTLEGTIAKFEDGTLVLRLAGATKDAPASERTLKVDEQTVVMRAVEGEPLQLRAPAPKGAKSMPRSIRYTKGTPEDIKAERRASVELSEDGQRADCVMVVQNSEPGAPPEGL
jgi:hypothetical protein